MAEQDTLVGRVLDGRYRIDAYVARGGMAVVYRGWDLRLNRTVAIKVMHAGLVNDTDFVGRFEREARNAARLAHHNAVAVHDQGEDVSDRGTTLFLVMEYIPGHTLRDLIRAEAPVPPERALDLLDPVVAALAAAHETGMIHRDMKPENVLIAEDGEVKVADFGLARAINAETQHTATGGVLIGTVSYLAPELVTQEGIDARADVYAVGVMLFELLTGQKPHQADSPIQVAYKHVYEDIPAPSSVVDTLPRYVDALVARACARDLDVRPATAGVLRQQLNRVRDALAQGLADDTELTADLTGDAAASRSLGRETASFAAQTMSTTRARMAHEDREHTPVQAPLPGSLLVAERPPSEIDRGSSDYWDSYEDASYDTDFQQRDTPPPLEPPAGSPARGIPRRRRFFTFLAALLALVLIGGGWYFFVYSYTTTPTVLSLSGAKAEQKLKSAELSYAVGGRDYSETTPKGAVLRTSPAAGNRIRKGDSVRVWLSRGPERHDVPTVAGSSVDDAQAAILDNKLSFGKRVDQWSESVPADRVIKSDPVTGTSLRRDAAVDLIVSKGPRPIKVPDTRGSAAAGAEQRLTKLGFKVNTTREFSDSVPKDKVASQSPDKGTAFRGDEIELVISKGPEMIEVPPLRGTGLGEARQLLRDRGFKVKVTRADLFVGLNYVVRQSTAGGNKAPAGSTITLTVV